MTPPTPSTATSRSAGISLGDRRGLTATGAVAALLLFGLAGGTYDVLTGQGLREVFAVSFVAGCLVAALTVHREDLVAVVVMPPLVYVVLVLLGGAVDGLAGAGSFLTRQVLELVNALILGAPALMLGTGVALLVAVARWLRGRPSR